MIVHLIYLHVTTFETITFSTLNWDIIKKIIKTIKEGVDIQG